MSWPVDGVAFRAITDDGILHCFNIPALFFIGGEEGAYGQPLLGVGRERVWSRQDSSLILLLSL